MYLVKLRLLRTLCRIKAVSWITYHSDPLRFWTQQTGEVMKTKVFTSEYKGHPIVQVFEVDDQGNKQGKYPVVSMGVKKAKALLDNQAEVALFIADNEKES